MKLVSRIFKRTNWYVTSSFGYRYHPITNKYSYHAGTDYGTNLEKWEQYGVEDGYVYIVHRGSSGYGNYIWVRYPRLNISLLHAHLDEIYVSQGQKVDKDTLLATTGKSGTATGIHLHLGMTEIGKSEWLNPHDYEYIDTIDTIDTIENNKNDELLELVKKCIRGDFGTGKTRFQKLGNNYEEVQKQVNLNYKNGTTSWNNIRLY